MNVSSFRSSHLAHLKNTTVWTCLALGAVPLWLYGVVSSELSISDLGIIDSFPVVFWIALGFILVSYLGLTLCPRPATASLAVLLLIVIASLWLFPLLLGASQPVAAHIWAKNGAFIAPLYASGGLDPERVWYHSWPAVWLIVVSLRHVTGVISANEAETLLPFVPFVIQLVLSVLMYVLLRSLWGKESNLVWRSLLVFVIANWSAQTYLAPQAYGLAVFILFLFLMAWRGAPGQQGRDPRTTLMLLLLVAGVTIGHLPSALFMIATLTVLYVLLRTLRFADSRVVGTTPLAAFVILVAWQFEWALPWTAQNIPDAIEAAFDLQGQFQSNVAERLVTGSDAHEFIARMRLSYSALWGFVGIGGALLALRAAKPATRFGVVLLGTVALSLLLVNVVVGGQMSEIVQRVHFFMLIPVAFFAAYLARHWVGGLMLTVILLAGLPLFFMTYYGDQKGDYLPADYVGSVEFFHASTDAGTVASRSPSWVPFGMFDPAEVYEVRSFEDMEKAVSNAASGLMEGDDYVILTDSDRRWTEMLGYQRQAFAYLSKEVESSEVYGLVYISPSVKIYAKLR